MKVNKSYDFSALENILAMIKVEQSNSILKSLQNELNNIFKPIKCREVLYTLNTDKLFFGMCVMPYINGDNALDILATNKNVMIDSYYIELDSKLFDPILNLSKSELTAILLHEIGHLVNDTRVIDEFRANVDIYMTKNNDSLVLSTSDYYKELLAFGIANSLRTMYTIFNKNDEEIKADTFASDCGYGVELVSALEKINKFSTNLNKDVSNKLSVMQWTLRLYKEVKLKRIVALRTLEKCKKSTPSKLEIRTINNAERNLKQIDDNIIIGEKFDLLKDFKHKGVRSYEDDFYEYKLRFKTTDQVDDVLVLLRQINTRISILEDLLNEDLSEKEYKKIDELRIKYLELRADLSKKDVYNYKYSDLWIQTPDIQPRRML